MSDTTDSNKGYDAETEAWLAVRKGAAAKIDPKTAEVTWSYGYVTDPYGVDSDLPAEDRVSGRVYFVREPGGEVWVSFDDLPDAVSARLLELHGSELHFPAGVPRSWRDVKLPKLSAWQWIKAVPWVLRGMAYVLLIIIRHRSFRS